MMIAFVKAAFPSFGLKEIVNDDDDCFYYYKK